MMPTIATDLPNGGVALFKKFLMVKNFSALKVRVPQKIALQLLTIPILIPAYTEVKVEADSQYSSQFTSANIIGKIFREHPGL